MLNEADKAVSIISFISGSGEYINGNQSKKKKRIVSNKMHFEMYILKLMDTLN